MSNQMNEDSESSIDNILFDERLDKDPLFEQPTEFEAAHVQPLKDKLLHFARFGNLLTLILGESGTGKTYLLEQFMTTLDDNVFVCHVAAQPLYSLEQLYQDICTSISTEELNDYPFDADSFREWLDGYALMSECHIVAIDDAEVLSQEVVREICRLSAYQQTLDVPKIQFMLFANHDLATSMDNVGRDILDESGIFIIDIPLLADSDAKQWLQYCLHRAGYLANDDELEELMSENNGNLVNLAEIAESYADEQLEEEQTDIIEEPEETVSVMGFWFAGLTVIVIGVLALFFYQKEINQWLFTEKPSVALVDQKPISASEKEILEEKTVDEPIVQTDSMTETTSDQLEAINENSQDGVTDRGIDRASDTKIATDNAADLSTKDDLLESSESTVASDVTLIENSQNETTASQETEVENATQNEPQPIYSAMEQALLDASDSDYVVQIIGLSNAQSINRLMTENSKLGLMTYRSSLKGKPWQIIVLPGFSNYQQAQQARLDLPKKLAEFQPWIKSQTKVKAEIRAAVSDIN